MHLTASTSNITSRPIRENDNSLCLDKEIRQKCFLLTRSLGKCLLNQFPEEKGAAVGEE